MKFSFKIITFVWTGIILFLSITPGNYIPRVSFKIIDPSTFAHVFFYGVLIFLMLKWKNPQLKQFKLWVTIFSITVLYGFLIELIQGNLIPGRFYDLYDIIANTFGSCLGLILYLVSNTKRM